MILAVFSYDENNNIDTIRNVLYNKYSAAYHISYNSNEDESLPIQIAISVSEEKINIYYGIPNFNEPDFIYLTNNNDAILTFKEICNMLPQPIRLKFYITPQNNYYVSKYVYKFKFDEPENDITLSQNDIARFTIFSEPSFTGDVLVSINNFTTGKYISNTISKKNDADFIRKIIDFSIIVEGGKK